MSKKKISKSKSLSKSKPKKAAAKKKATPKKKAAPKAKKPVKAKKSVKAKKPVKARAKAAPKSKAKAKVVKKAKAKKPVKKTVAASKSKPAAKVVKQKAAPVKSAPVAPPKKEVEKKNDPAKPATFVGRPMPVNRRPEPARDIIQNSPPEKETGKNRYSDAELEEFREIINKKLEDARKELATLQAQLTAANEHGTDDTASTFKILEDGSDSLAKEEAGQLASRQKKFIEQLENALVRIENKTYGICRVTGKLIRKERLRAVPHTTQSIEAKLNQYRE